MTINVVETRNGFILFKEDTVITLLWSHRSLSSVWYVMGPTLLLSSYSCSRSFTFSHSYSHSCVCLLYFLATELLLVIMRMRAFTPHVMPLLHRAAFLCPEVREEPAV